MPSAIDVQAEALAHPDDRADQLGAALPAGHGHHERPVDLERVEAEPVQRLERGVARTEVVDVHRQPAFVHLLEQGLGPGARCA